MKIHTQSEEMFWILCKINKDMLDFCCDGSDKEVLSTKRSEWIKTWQQKMLTKEMISLWMPRIKTSGDANDH